MLNLRSQFEATKRPTMICNICYNNRKPTRKQGLSPEAQGTELSGLVNYSTKICLRFGWSCRCNYAINKSKYLPYNFQVTCSKSIYCHYADCIHAIKIINHKGKGK